MAAARRRQRRVPRDAGGAVRGRAAPGHRRRRAPGHDGQGRLPGARALRRAGPAARARGHAWRAGRCAPPTCASGRCACARARWSPPAHALGAPRPGRPAAPRRAPRGSALRLPRPADAAARTARAPTAARGSGARRRRGRRARCDRCGARARTPGIPVAGWLAVALLAARPAGRRARAPAPRGAPARRGAGGARGPLVASVADGLLLRHHPDLLRQRGAAPGPRVHDDRRRRDGAPSPPARRRRVLPHRDRRARRAGGRRGQGAGPRAPRAGRPQRRALQGAGAGAGGHERLLHPHLRPRAHPPGAGGAPARLRQRLRAQGPLRGLVLPAVRGLQGGERDRGGQSLPDPPHRARAPQRGELLLRAQRLPGAPRGAVRVAAGLRRAAVALQRGARLHQERAAGRVALAREPHLGRAGAVGRASTSSTSGSTRC